MLFDSVFLNVSAEDPALQDRKSFEDAEQWMATVEWM
jgi:hypothetical protein